MFGVRELNTGEFDISCQNNTGESNRTLLINDRTANFTANYHIRTYTSGCFYLDDNQEWQSQGLIVCR